MESSQSLYQKLKINKLKNNIILNNCLFVFDKLTNNLPDVFHQFFQPLKEQHNHNTRGSQQYLLNIHNTQIHKCLVPKRFEWNNSQNSFQLWTFFKCAEFIKLVKSTFHDIWFQNKATRQHTLYETTIKKHCYNFLMWFIEWDS